MIVKLVFSLTIEKWIKPIYNSLILITFSLWVQRVGISSTFCCNHVSTQEKTISRSLGTVMFLLQPTVTVFLAHCERDATILFSTVVVTISDTLASEAPDVSTHVDYVIFNTGWNKLSYHIKDAYNSCKWNIISPLDLFQEYKSWFIIL